MMEREELLEMVTAEIKHNISPVIGFLRMDAKRGRVDDDKERLNDYRNSVAKAAESIVSLLLDEKSKEPETVATDVYLRGEWYVTILKMDLNEDQVRLLDELSERAGDASTTIEVHEHSPEYPLPNWKGYTRK